MEHLQRVPRPSPAASGQDRSPLRLMERISRAKNRMRQSRSSGTVGGEGGNLLAYPALQSIRYASMVSSMTFDQAARVYGQYLKQLGKANDDPRTKILDFLGWPEPDDDRFAQDVRIVLASSEFSKELTSSVLWLIDHDLDITCVRMKPYNLDNRVLVDVQQIIPLPEAAEYQVQVREKIRKERESRTSNAGFTRFDVHLEGEEHQSMWKRNAIFLICRRLCAKEISPDEIAGLFEWRPNRVWYVVDGNVDTATFAKLASEKAIKTGSALNTDRWFCEDDDDLVRANGKTYAFSNQWGGSNWHRAMEALKNKYREFQIDFHPTA
jgi:hypothetical protein